MQIHFWQFDFEWYVGQYIFPIFCEIEIELVMDVNNSESTWISLWLGVAREQAIIWTTVDRDVCRHMVSLGHN